MLHLRKIIVKHILKQDVFNGQRTQPCQMLAGPVRPVGINIAVTGQKLQQLMPGTLYVLLSGLPAAGQLTRRFLLRIRGMDCGAKREVDTGNEGFGSVQCVSKLQECP